MDIEFINTKQVYLIKDVKIEDLIDYKNNANLVVLFGFPYDEGTKRNKGRAGGENAYE